MPASGGYSTGGGNSLSWTLGQPFNNTLSNGSKLSQGEQQPEVQIFTNALSGASFCAGGSVSVPFTASGFVDNTNVFTAELSNSSGSFASPVNIGTVTSMVSGTISATIPGGTAAGTAYRIRVVGSNPVFNGTNNGTDLTITANVTPSVSIGASQTTICTGTSVTFTATPTNGGGAPTYDFKVNGTSVQNSSSATYTTTGIANNDAVTCEMTANNTCQTTATATSNSIAMTVTGSVTPSVALGASASTICNGVSVTFTATPTNGGGAPVYNFKVNGSSVQNSSTATYSSTTLANNDAVLVEMTSNNSCQTTANSTSNTVTMTVNANVTPSVSIGASSSSICAGTSVTITATPTNGGGAPTYDFKVNGTSVQNSSSATYTSTTLANSDAVTCEMTANNTCQTTATANSNTISMTVTANVTPSVSIGASQTTICAGTSVTITATPTNGGGAPIYNFKVNGTSVQNSSAVTYTSTSLADNDDVTCVMTANNTCQTTATATSSGITMSVTTNITPSVALGASASTICVGGSVTLTATPTNGGPSPIYNFKVNGTSVQNGSSDNYSSTTLANNDAVTCVMTANNTCQTSATATSSAVTMTVNNYVTPSVALSAASTSICIGVSDTFTATPTNGGPSPTYEFFVNGFSLQNSANNKFIRNTLSNGSSITVTITANGACQTTPNANSSAVVVTVSNCAQSIQSGSWFNPAVWLGNTVPPASSNVTMASGSNIDISLSTGVTITDIFIGATDTLFLNNGANMVVNGTMTLQGGLVMNGGMITFTKPGYSIPAATYHQLKLCAAGTMYISANTTVNNNFFICSGTTFNDSGRVLSVKGNVQNDGTHVSLNSNGKIVLNGTGSQQLVNAGGYTSPYGNMEITNTNVVRIGSSGTTANMPHIFNGKLALTNAGLNVTGNTVTFANTADVSNGGTFLISSVIATGNVVVNGDASSPKITGIGFSLKGNFTLDRPAGMVLKANSTTDAVLTLTDGKLEQNGMNLTVGGSTTSNGKVICTSGRINNNSTTAGTFTLQGDAFAPSSTNLLMDTLFRFTYRIPAGCTMGSNVFIRDAASFITGKLDLNGFVVDLGSTGFLSEVAGSQLFGNTGYITTTRTLSFIPVNFNIAGMGLQLSHSLSPGTVTLERHHNVLTSGTGSSIKRYYDFRVSNAGTSTIQLFYDTLYEKNGTMQSALRMNSSTNSGTIWNTLTNVTRSGAAGQSWVRKTGISLGAVSTWFTLSDSVTGPLSPVIVSGVSQVSSAGGTFTAWPNPASSQLFVSYETKQSATLQIHSIDGKTVYQQLLKASIMPITETLDISILPAGMYIVTLSSGNNQYQTRIIKVNQ
jgi:hypothetical protein